MTFPNAYAGVKKLVTAEALQIICSGLGILVAVLALATAAGAGSAIATGNGLNAVGALGVGIGVILCGLAILVLSIISVVLTLLGLKAASIDETKYFKTAFTTAVVLLIASIVKGLSGVIPFLATFDSALSIFTNVCTIAVFSFTVYGISALAKELNRPDMVSLGNVIIIIQIISLVINVIAAFISFLSFFSAIAAFICYIIYLVYLTKAKKMLEA